MHTDKSITAYKRAVKSIPGGVNSPARAFKSVGSNPLFIAKAEGSRIYDIDGNEYFDYVGSWGPMILGHAHPDVIKILHETAQNGFPGLPVCRGKGFLHRDGRSISDRPIQGRPQE